MHFSAPYSLIWISRKATRHERRKKFRIFRRNRKLEGNTLILNRTDEYEFWLWNMNWNHELNWIHEFLLVKYQVLFKAFRRFLQYIFYEISCRYITKFYNETSLSIIYLCLAPFIIQHPLWTNIFIKISNARFLFFLISEKKM